MIARAAGIVMVTTGSGIAALSALIWFFVPMTSGKPPYFAIGTGIGGIAYAAVGRFLHERFAHAK
jgi:hypothetical protein